MGLRADEQSGRGERPGGRFNRPGVEALYLSRGPQTALAEYQQGASITPPATLAAYTVTLDEVADLAAGYDPAAWASGWAQWDCAWRQIARIDKKIPPSWTLGDEVITTGCRGLLFPLLRHPGGVNLVIFNANSPLQMRSRYMTPTVAFRTTSPRGRRRHRAAVFQLFGARRARAASAQPHA